MKHNIFPLLPGACTRLLSCLSAVAGMLVAAEAYSQSPVESVLMEVEKNNPALKASQAEAEAEKLANRSEALLDNPEIEFNYLIGAQNIGNRHDIRVSQGFDFATLAGMKAAKVEGMNELSSLKYRSERLQILLQAKQACIDLTHANALRNELQTHLEQARTLVASFEKRVAAGSATILDLNKAKVHLTAVQGKVSQNEVERQALLSELRSLNGGVDIGYEACAYDSGETLPEDFEQWFNEASGKNPALMYAAREVAVGQKELQISRTSWAPELSVGYMGEIRTAEKFHGVTLGVSIPLWSNSNRVKQNKAKVAAATSRKEAVESEFYHNLQNQFITASNLKKSSEMMRASLNETDNRDFLLSAQSKGEISMVDYLVETDLYYEALEQTLEAERNYRQALASLNAMNL